MLETLFYILVGVALAIGVLAAIASRKPDEFRVARSLLINATPEAIFPMINDLRAMNTWNPFSLRDPTSVTSYSGPTSGPGARHAFDGPKSGSGTIQITESEPHKQVAMRLTMTRPIKADNRVELTLVPRAQGTEVTWAMSGRSPLFIKIMTLFFNHDAMMTTAFDEGLANLKAAVEKA
jgi:Polyketide cyclase / dehydrase and lipid transport